MAIGAPLAWAGLHRTGPAQFGSGTAVALASGSAHATATDAPTAPPTGSVPDPVVVSSAPPATAGAKPPARQVVAVPVRIQIPALGVDAAVEPEGVDGHGEMAIPEDVRTIGWYRFGPAPGAAAGSAVLVGHVDSAEQGLGAFFGLPNLRRGDVISVTSADARVHRFRVVAREEFDKSVVPLASIFARDGAPRLTLVTCGGSFDRAARSYRDNIVVTAEPADRP